ncbi:MAG: hypothetical protein IJE43_16810 [Alphaproteobacteria bacterium]|nr:hypothetical protein [Alphaproteobacteria bacterium]
MANKYEDFERFLKANFNSEWLRFTNEDAKEDTKNTIFANHQKGFNIYKRLSETGMLKNDYIPPEVLSGQLTVEEFFFRMQEYEGQNIVYDNGLITAVRMKYAENLPNMVYTEDPIKQIFIKSEHAKEIGLKGETCDRYIQGFADSYLVLSKAEKLGIPKEQATFIVEKSNSIDSMIQLFEAQKRIDQAKTPEDKKTAIEQYDILHKESQEVLEKHGKDILDLLDKAIEIKEAENANDNPKDKADDNAPNTADDKPKDKADDNAPNTADDKPKDKADDNTPNTADDKPKDKADDNTPNTADDKPKGSKDSRDDSYSYGIDDEHEAKYGIKYEDDEAYKSPIYSSPQRTSKPESFALSEPIDFTESTLQEEHGTSRSFNSIFASYIKTAEDVSSRGIAQALAQNYTLEELRDLRKRTEEDIYKNTHDIAQEALRRVRALTQNRPSSTQPTAQPTQQTTSSRRTSSSYSFLRDNEVEI